MEKSTMFPYSWHMDEDEEYVTAMRVYGLNEANEKRVRQNKQFYTFCIFTIT